MLDFAIHFYASVKNESWLHLSEKLPTKPLFMGWGVVMPPLNPLDFVFGLITTFGIYVAILVITFLLDIENLFIDKQDLVINAFLGTFLATFCTFYNVFFWVLHLINDSHSSYAY